VTFPGFNQLQLRGSVLAADGLPWFAVLVPDAGPLDRDWANPMLPGSHGGRAVADWLRAQGVASLRYDKRIHGARNHRLDTSLDAQAGDVLAALAAAREQPEARGRKLLLVGHGEGALLALLDSRAADALLLLAMPPASMAKSIAAQLRPQLPGDSAGPNLKYLESVFQAIRERRPPPPAQPEVFSGMSRLGNALMAPETLDFVRATLDLDPWPLAARANGPVALVWGDRDIQAWKPALIPAGFRGTVLEIPEANHLLKREPRPRTELNGVAALSGYGDEVPLADLGPVAAWLKALP
jgi:alpha-beta hydrolase superfamily lysophospholipase